MRTDRALERFVRGLELRAQSPPMLTGFRLETRCACGNRHRSYKLDARSGRYREFCSRCGGLWPRRRVSVSRKQIDGGRRPDPQRRLLEDIALGRAVARLSSVEFEVLRMVATWRGPGRAYSGVAEIAARRFPAEFRWTPYRVREVVRTARAVLGAALRDEGVSKS